MIGWAAEQDLSHGQADQLRFRELRFATRSPRGPAEQVVNGDVESDDESF